MKKAWLLILLICFSFFSLHANAYDIGKDDFVFVGGESIGLELQTDVCVVGTYGIEVDGNIYKPWQEAGIQDGDYILSYDNVKITSGKVLQNLVNSSKGSEKQIELLRNDSIIKTTIKSIQNKGVYSLGVYIKDKILGVGTLTYYIPKIGLFGSLGHSITEKETYGGCIFKSNVNSIIKSKRNFAGEKRASIVGNPIGSILKNTITGVHGTSTSIDTSKMKKMKYAKRSEVHTGKAIIRTCIENNKVEEFDIMITKCQNQSSKDIKGLKIEIIDERLIEKTGGIVQGMSGSPIIQDNKLVGAVTHVILSNPLEGYGVYLDFMYEDLNINIR